MLPYGLANQQLCCFQMLPEKYGEQDQELSEEFLVITDPACLFEISCRRNSRHTPKPGSFHFQLIYAMDRTKVRSPCLKPTFIVHGLLKKSLKKTAGDSYIYVYSGIILQFIGVGLFGRVVKREATLYKYVIMVARVFSLSPLYRRWFYGKSACGSERIISRRSLVKRSSAKHG